MNRRLVHSKNEVKKTIAAGLKGSWLAIAALLKLCGSVFLNKRAIPYIFAVIFALLISAAWWTWEPDFAHSWLPQGKKEVALSLSTKLLANTEPQAAKYSRNAIIKKDEKLDDLLIRLNVSKANRKKINAYRSKLLPRGASSAMYAGRTVAARFSKEGDLQALDIATSRKKFVKLILIDDKIKGESWSKAQRWFERMGGGVINRSLFATTDNSNIPDTLALQVAEIFATDIDFTREIQRGDEIWVVYRQLMIDGIYQPEVKLQAIRLLNRKKTRWAFYYTKKHGNEMDNYKREAQLNVNAASSKNKKVDTTIDGINSASRYYNKEGKSLVRGFLRNPLKFTRISSRFNLSRFHPILHKIRAHKGVDFAAAKGTPIQAVGDGTVQFIGVQRGYGNIIILKHKKTIETRYAHLSAFAKNLKKGDKVEQTEVIGYVGQTGYATGPHLHYEFRVAGRPHDPLLVNLPHGASISVADIKSFHLVRERYLYLLQLAESAPILPIE